MIHPLLKELIPVGKIHIDAGVSLEVQHVAGKLFFLFVLFSVAAESR